MPEYAALSASALPSAIAAWLAGDTGDTGIVRVAIDGAPCTRPADVADALEGPLRERGRPFVHVRAESFWRDASLRFEFGREDADAYPTWLDEQALRREVLTGTTYLPSLRDPATNRSTHEPAVPVPPLAILVVSGPLLQGLGLPFDRVVHLSMSPAALARCTPADEQWTLPAFARYEAEVDPVANADVVVRLDHPDRPAVAGLSTSRG